MSDRKATNRYYPPEFWDQKNFSDKSNLNSFRGEGWRNRGAQVNSKLLTQGRNVIRFETPFDIVCGSCEEVIHKGVRFNADKRKAGNYFSTTIWEFELKCAKCDHKMFMLTDPENTTYKCGEGCRPVVQGWGEDEDTLKMPDKKEQRRLESDPFFKLEHTAADDGSGRRRDEVKAKEMKPVIGQLRDLQDPRGKDDALLNRALRKAFRADKKEIARKDMEDAAERDRLNLGIALLPASAEDRQAAAMVQFGRNPPREGGKEEEEARYRAAKRRKRREIMDAPLLPAAPPASSAGPPVGGGGGASAGGSTPLASSSSSGGEGAARDGVRRVGGGGRKGSGVMIVAKRAGTTVEGLGRGGLSPAGAGGSVLDCLGAYGDDDGSGSE